MTRRKRCWNMISEMPRLCYLRPARKAIHLHSKFSSDAYSRWLSGTSYALQRLWIATWFIQLCFDTIARTRSTKSLKVDAWADRKIVQLIFRLAQATFLVCEVSEDLNFTQKFLVRRSFDVAQTTYSHQQSRPRYLAITFPLSHPLPSPPR